MIEIGKEYNWLTVLEKISLSQIKITPIGFVNVDVEKSKALEEIKFHLAQQNLVAVIIPYQELMIFETKFLIF